MLMSLWSFLGSRKHFAGMAMMLVGIGLAVIDPVGPQAIVLIAAFYVAGAVATPARSPLSRLASDPRQVDRALAKTVSAAGGRVSPEVMARLRRIELIIRAEILPRLDRLPPGSAELHVVGSTVRDYLPAALDAYICLPAGYVSIQPGSEGQTALGILLEELDLLEAEMRSVAVSIQRNDMDRLLAHRRFLIERVGRTPPAKLSL
jgi:hypothetical protein